MRNLSLVVNSHSKSSDLWPGFFGELDYYSNNLPSWDKIFLFTSSDSDTLNLPQNVTSLYYSPSLPYSLQYLSCLRRVKDEYVLICNEDCIPVGNISRDSIEYVINVLDSSSFSFVKLGRGPERIHHTCFRNLFEIDRYAQPFFTQQVSIWKRKSLLAIYTLSPPSYIGRTGGIQQEEIGNNVAKEIGITGLQYFEGWETQKGLYHYESSVFPHIATALVGGKWNTQEYPFEMSNFFLKYNIDKSIRGEFKWQTS